MIYKWYIGWDWLGENIRIHVEKEHEKQQRTWRFQEANKNPVGTEWKGVKDREEYMKLGEVGALIVKAFVGQIKDFGSH